VLGEIADVYTEMGDLDKAGQASAFIALHIALLCFGLYNTVKRDGWHDVFCIQTWDTFVCIDQEIADAAMLSQDLHT